MTEREKLEIDLDSIKWVYQEQYKAIKEKLSKEKYPKIKDASSLECFATDLDNFYWTTKECIIRAERLGVTYNKDELLERLTKKFPDILFESCASGGGRYDLGMLYYMPQTWGSDNSNANNRCYIACGTLTGYPQSTLGAHISRDYRNDLETIYKI